MPLFFFLYSCHEMYSMMPAPAATAANCVSVFRSSSPLLGPVSSSSGMTATVPTYKKVPAVKGSSISPHV